MKWYKMSLENEFSKHYDRFHAYAEKSSALYHLYIGTKQRRALDSWIKHASSAKDCLINLLKIKNKKILRVFSQWENPKETLEDVEEILEKKIGGHLVADTTYVFWKQAYLASKIKSMRDSLTNRVLLEQAIVTICSAYECYLKELIPWILKNHKNSAKRFLGGLREPTKFLGKYKFEPLKHVDKIYFEINQNKQLPLFDDLLTQYKEYFDISLFFTKQEEKYVKKIYQVRHCIVHNEGKPDAKWHALTKGAKFEINEKTTWEYMTKLHEKMHDVSSQVFDYMKLNEKYVPWISAKEPVEGKMFFNGKRWKWIPPKKLKTTRRPPEEIQALVS